VNGSVTTGTASAQPVCSATARTSSSVVRGVIRSTMVVTNDTCSRIQAASAGSAASASSVTTRSVAGPLPGTLSQETTASEPAFAARRAARPATRRPGVVPVVPPRCSAARSARTSGSSRSRPPSRTRRYAASVTVSVTTATCGRARWSHHDSRSVPGCAATTACCTDISSCCGPRTTSVYRPS
jgi:hypothetical protein